MNSKLKIALGTFGRFHMYDLARQLSKLDQEVNLFTCYPNFKVDPDLRRITHTHPYLMMPEQLRRRLPGTPSPRWTEATTVDFGRWLGNAVRKMDVDVLDVLDAGGTEAGPLVQSRGKLWVCNRGSAHVMVQKQLLEEEHRDWKIPMPGDYFPPSVLRRGLAEYEAADAIIVPSVFARRTFLEQGIPSEKIAVSPYGVELATYRPHPKTDQKFRILFVGTRSLQKGIGYLLEAVQPLVKKGLVETWFIGHRSPEIQPLLDRYRGTFIDQGIISRTKLAAFYSQGSVLVLPSIQDGFGLVMAQAMACGVPVIATHNTGAEDLFTDGVEGFVIPIRSAEAIREKIQWMLDNPEGQRLMGEAALRRVQGMGGWAHFGERCLGIYQHFLARKNSPMEKKTEEAARPNLGTIRSTREETHASLKIAVGTFGRFHMFDLARQLAKLGQESHLYTGHPRLKVDQDLRQRTSTRPFWTVLEHLRGRLPGVPSPRWTETSTRDFGQWLGDEIGKSDVDVLDVLDGGGSEAGPIVRNRGKLWICNRGSTHILTQKRLLEEEHRLWKVPLPRDLFPPDVVARCLAEYDGADAIIVPTDFTRRTFIDEGVDPEKLAISPYGVDLSMFRPHPKEDTKFRVLFVGTQSIRKGIGYVLQAVEPLVKARAAEMWVIGHHREEVRPILEKYEGIFVNHGPQPRKKLPWFYSQGSVLVLPSIEEGLALVQAQAMACGIPVIATPNAGAANLFTDGVEGFVVPVRDPEAIRERIQWMLDNPVAHREMGMRALQRVESLGGWEQYGQRCLDIYRHFIERKGSHRAAASARV